MTSARDLSPGRAFGIHWPTSQRSPARIRIARDEIDFLAPNFRRRTAARLDRVCGTSAFSGERLEKARCFIAREATSQERISSLPREYLENSLDRYARGEPYYRSFRYSTLSSGAVYYLTVVRGYGRSVNFRIFVSALPRERVFPGCYFSTLNTRSPLTQRPISRLRGGNSVSVIEIIRTLRRLGAHLCSINAEGDRSTGATVGREGMGGARVKERSCAARARKAQKGSKRGDGRRSTVPT